MAVADMSCLAHAEGSYQNTYCTVLKSADPLVEAKHLMRQGYALDILMCKDCMQPIDHRSYPARPDQRTISHNDDRICGYNKHTSC